MLGAIKYTNSIIYIRAKDALIVGRMIMRTILRGRGEPLETARGDIHTNAMIEIINESVACCAMISKEA